MDIGDLDLKSNFLPIFFFFFFWGLQIQAKKIENEPFSYFLT